MIHIVLTTGKSFPTPITLVRLVFFSNAIKPWLSVLARPSLSCCCRQCLRRSPVVLKLSRQSRPLNTIVSYVPDSQGSMGTSGILKAGDGAIGVMFWSHAPFHISSPSERSAR